ncbi:hypothetical protein ACJ41O_004319 [Fusarium nematophilum]
MATLHGFKSQHGSGQDASSRSEPPGPLKIAIIGAGIGGLSAAIGLRRQGHHIDLYERSSFATEIGAGVHLAPNANGILRRWGILAEEFGGNFMSHLYEFRQNGSLIKHVDLTALNARWQHPWHLVHRVALHDRLKRAATGEDGPGRPAALHVSSKVVRVDPLKGSIELADGSATRADVVLGADGIHSISRQFISERMPQVVSTGKAAFRFVLPRQLAEEDPETKPLVEAHDAAYMWFGDDRRVILYPCNGNKTLNFVCIHPESESHEAATDEWDKAGSLSQLLKVFENFDPTLLKLFQKANPKELKVWQLLDMEKPKSWVNKRLALLGDAAHPFTPRQGACQAIEDAAVLAVVFPRGTRPADVPERLKLYEKIRYERAHTVQDHSRKVGTDWKDGKPQIDPMVFRGYNFAHDAHDCAQNVFKRHLWAEVDDANWRMPVSFGPFPEFRHNISSRTPSRAQQTFETATVRFKTSRTYLESFLPTEAYTFENEATVCEASFSITTQKNVPWLGGSDHHRFGLYMHGVKYRKGDGSTAQGTFVPLLMENSAEMVISSREALGMPALFCDLETCSISKSYRMRASSRNVVLAELLIDDLEDVVEAAIDVVGDASGCDLLAHRFIPAVGNHGKPDAYAVTATRNGTEGAGCNITKRLRSKRASIKLEGHDWESLPTLHHVAMGLAGIPVYSIMTAEVTRGSGIPDNFSYGRVE